MNQTGMKRKTALTYLFMFLSIIMLGVPVIPHHHHSDGLICLKNDVTAECCEHTSGEEEETSSSEIRVLTHAHTASHGHCCCDTGCITTHFVQQSPANPDNGGVYPEFTRIITLYPEFITFLLNFPETAEADNDFIYRERLHSTYLTRAKGLRAPPVILS